MAAQSEINRWFRRRPRCCVIGHAADASQHRQACGGSVASPQNPIARRLGPEHDQVTAPTLGCARITPQMQTWTSESRRTRTTGAPAFRCLKARVGRTLPGSRRIGGGHRAGSWRQRQPSFQLKRLHLQAQVPAAAPMRRRYCCWSPRGGGSRSLICLVTLFCSRRTIRRAATDVRQQVATTPSRLNT